MRSRLSSYSKVKLPILGLGSRYAKIARKQVYFRAHMRDYVYKKKSTINVVGTGMINLPISIALPELLAHMPDGLVVLDQGGVVVAFNDTASHLLNTQQRDWNGREF